MLAEPAVFSVIKCKDGSYTRVCSNAGHNAVKAVEKNVRLYSSAEMPHVNDASDMSDAVVSVGFSPQIVAFVSYQAVKSFTEAVYMLAEPSNGHAILDTLQLNQLVALRKYVVPWRCLTRMTVQNLNISLYDDQVRVGSVDFSQASIISRSQNSLRQCSVDNVRVALNNEATNIDISKLEAYATDSGQSDI